MKDEQIHEAIEILREAVQQWDPAMVDEKGQSHEWDPYQILIATILSLRTKDTLTAEVAPKLFALADNPYDMVELSQQKIADTIYPVGFYNNKSKQILQSSQMIIDEYDGKTPDDLDELLKLPGVGRKTANLVVTAGYNKPGICVDIHVHRISNRWGYIDTKTPDKSEFALRDKLPQEYWIEYNGLLVTFGQNLCTPQSPWCSQCPLDHLCERVGVERHR